MIKITKEKSNLNLIIAISFLLVAALGITYAFFSASSIGEEDSVKVKSARLRLRFISYENAWSDRTLIPASTSVVKYSFERQNDTTITDIKTQSNGICKDDYGDSICSMYVFQVKNITDSKQLLMMELKSTANGFSNLNSMLYEIKIDNENDYYSKVIDNAINTFNGITDPLFYETPEEIEEDANSGEVKERKISVQASDANLKDETYGTAFLKKGDVDEDNNYVYYSPILVNRKGVSKKILTYSDENDETHLSIDIEVPSLGKKVKLTDGIEIENEETKTFALVLYIKDSNKEQTDVDSAKTYTGEILVNKGDGSYMVTGTINGYKSDNLQVNEDNN